MLEFLTAYTKQDDAWVCGVCIGIIIICLIFLGVHLFRFFHYENELEREARRREKVNKIMRRNRRN